MAVSAVRAGLYISLNQCSYEHGLGTLSGQRDRLASDEPKASTDLAHLNPCVQDDGPVAFADTLFGTPP